MVTHEDLGIHFGPLPEGFGSETQRSGKFIDIEILGKLSVSGDLTLSSGATIKAGLGSISDLVLGMGTDSNDGIYSPDTGQIGFVTLGFKRGIVDNAGSLRWGSGSASVPSYSFLEDSDTGMYRVGADSLGMSVAGALVAKFTAGVFSGPRSTTGEALMRMTAAGSDSAPSFTFHDDEDTGMYRVGANSLGFAVAGALEMTLTTARFDVPNVYSDTEAASANVVVLSNGRIKRATSARKYKEDIKQARYLADYVLEPVEFTSKLDHRKYLGFIADDVAAQDSRLGVTSLDDDEIEDFDTRGVMAVMAAKINRLEKRLKELEK